MSLCRSGVKWSVTPVSDTHVLGVWLCLETWLFVDESATNVFRRMKVLVVVIDTMKHDQELDSQSSHIFVILVFEIDF